MTHDALREALGLAPEDRLESHTRHPARRDRSVQHGFAAGELTDLQALLDTDPTLLPPLQAPDDVQLYPVAGEPGLLALATSDPAAEVQAVLGILAPQETWFVIDGRAGLAAARVQSLDAEWVVSVDPTGRVEVLAVERSGPVARWRPEPAAVGDPPSTDALLEGHGCDPDLRARLQALTDTGWALDEVARVGTLARLWTPTTRQARLEALRTRTLPPIDRARAWADGLDARVIATLRHLCDLEIERLHDTLDGIEEDPEAADAAVALELASRRDALESVEHLLRGRPEPLSLGPPLTILDGRATSLWSALPEADSLGHVAWLRQVAVGRPDGWWTAWAVP